MGAVEDQSIQGAIDEARKRGCRHLPTESNLVKGLQEWLAEIGKEVERFGASAGAPCWDLRVWDADVPSFCVFETLVKPGEVELSFFVIAEAPRDVINWCESEAPTEVAAARADFRKRWGDPYATTTAKAPMTPQEAFAAYEKALLSPGLTVSQMEAAERALYDSVNPKLRDHYVEPLERMIAMLPTLGFGKATTVARTLVSFAAMTELTTRPLDALAAKLVGLIRAAHRFVDGVASAPELREAADEGPGALSVGPVGVPEVWWRRFGEKDAEAVWAFRYLDSWLNALAALVVRDRAARLDVLGRNELVTELGKLYGVVESARSFRTILFAPNREIFRVLHFPTKRVFEVELDEVGINFELHVLLLSELAEPLGMQRPLQHIIDVTKGIADRPNPPDVETVWEFFSARALRALFERREPSLDDRIWNEGIPADIPRHDGIRLIVVAPASARATWGAGRAHFESRPNAKLLSELPEREAQRLVEQLAL